MVVGSRGFLDSVSAAAKPSEGIEGIRDISSTDDFVSRMKDSEGIEQRSQPVRRYYEAHWVGGMISVR